MIRLLAIFFILFRPRTNELAVLRRRVWEAEHTAQMLRAELETLRARLKGQETT